MPGGQSRQGPCVAIGKIPKSGSYLQFSYRQPGYGFSIFLGYKLTKKARRGETGRENGGCLASRSCKRVEKPSGSGLYK